MPRSAGPGRRGEIFETFVHHVAARGYDQTNLGDIATELGMSKGTIVHHFGVKAQMLRELEDGYMRRQLAAVQAMWDQLPTPPERVAAIVYASVLLHVVDHDATVASQREVLQLAQDPQMQEIRRMRRQSQLLVTTEIQRGIDEGLFRPVDVELATLSVFGSVQWMWTWFDPNGSQTAEEVGAAFVDLALGGLLVDRFNLSKLADPNSRIVAIVKECLAGPGSADQAALA